jgi:hypothetical protein
MRQRPETLAEEYRMIGSSGELIVLGVNFRVYDSAKQVWNIKWSNALEGTWTDITSEQSIWGRVSYFK